MNQARVCLVIETNIFNIFDEGFGGFSTLRKRNLRNMAVKRRPEMDPRGFDGDAFTGDACQRIE